MWVIAPPGADLIHLEFLFFDMGPDYIYNNVVIDMCYDITCSDSSPLPGSPFEMHAGASPLRDIASATTGFVRVSFPAVGSEHTQARFVLYYSTDSAKKKNPPELSINSWHYIAAVVESVDESSFSASIYVNGTIIAGPAYFLFEDRSGLAFALAGQSGIALGRSQPMSAPFGYFTGKVDELLAVDRNMLGDEMGLIMNMSCSNVPHTLLCYTFDRTTVSANGSLQDLGSGLSSHAVAVRQDRFMPWCITRNDGGQLVLDSLGTIPYAVSWGFCTSKALLPGVGFSYDANALDFLSKTVEKDSYEFNLKELPGCSNIPLIIESNTAGRCVCYFLCMRISYTINDDQLHEIIFQKWGRHISWHVQ